MVDGEREEYRPAALARRGTRLADLPADFRGLLWGAYMNSVWAEWIAAAAAARTGAPETPAIATARDSYGWRSLPAGSRYLGAAGGGKR